MARADNRDECSVLLTVNGERRELPSEPTILGLLATMNLQPETTIVERNGTVVDRAQYAAVQLAEGDTIELVRMVGGG